MSCSASNFIDLAQIAVDRGALVAGNELNEVQKSIDWTSYVFLKDVDLNGVVRLSEWIKNNNG
jgi:hypothetical protein